MEKSQCLVKRIDREPDAVVITWQDGGRSVISHLWLKDQDPDNFHPVTGARIRDCNLNQRPYPRSVALEYEETLVIGWSRGWEVSRYAVSWLQAHRKPYEAPAINQSNATAATDFKTARRGAYQNLRDRVAHCVSWLARPAHGLPKTQRAR